MTLKHPLHIFGRRKQLLIKHTKNQTFTTMERTSEKCILCDQKEREQILYQAKWTIHRCRSCGLGVLDPRPNADELSELYQKDYFEDQYDRGLEIGSHELKRRLSQETHRIRFFRRLKKRGRILDIGCGMGYFLAACRSFGYDVEGMDISSYSAAYVQDQLGIPVTVGTIENISFPPDSFDVVTLWHFLEHTPDPRLYLSKCRQWLKPTGLVVIDVPNYTGTDARLSGANWIGWQPPYHLYHFTPATLERLLTKHHFSVLRRKSYLSECVKERLERTGILKPIARLVARCYSGHSYAVVAEKSSLHDDAA